MVQGIFWESNQINYLQNCCLMSKRDKKFGLENIIIPKNSFRYPSIRITVAGYERNCSFMQLRTYFHEDLTAG